MQPRRAVDHEPLERGIGPRLGIRACDCGKERGTARELYANQRHPYTLGLLRSVPRLDEPRRSRLDPIEGQPPDLSRLPADHWLRTPWTAGFYMYEPRQATWTRCYDGLFFIDAQKPSTPLSPRPPPTDISHGEGRGPG